MRTLLSVLLLAALAMLLSTPAEAAPCPTPITMSRTLDSDCEGGIVITADNVRLNCAGHTLTGDRTSNGIEVSGRLAVIVEDCRVTNFADGFHIVNTQRSIFRGNSAFLNTDEGFSVENSDGNLFIRNIAGGSTAGGTLLGNGGDGFDLDNSHENFFFGNTVAWNGFRGSVQNPFPACNAVNCNGIELDFSDANVFEENQSRSNQNHGFSIDASDANIFSQNIANTNGADGFELERFSSRNTFSNNIADGNVDRDADVNPDSAGSCNIFVGNSFRSGRTRGLDRPCINLPD